ncbi:glutamate--cysteine ligase [Hydrogenophilus thermoluteolus]|uniref:glutamate--cysteine ligase n=1 Tax=Hydrogenophilus thermoluteolus TaxID=297 RepID=UPI0024A35F41|nr:glutamate--cysteine ligase [Hydrogenophilus thermoluteolus]GLW60477.1 glutamate--cysteine ligase [Hydrogenophilus thermoluteolus]
MIPHLTTALSGPLLEIEHQFLAHQPAIERWFRHWFTEHMPPFYASTDLRNAGFKLAPVDLNLFPGGFNNLAEPFTPLAVQALQVAIERVCPEARQFLLIPENHTRNRFYLSNVFHLQRLLRLAGVEVRVGSLLPEITEPTPFETPAGTLILEPIVRRGNRVGLADFDPCAILLNNDLSAGIPAILAEPLEQIVIPPPQAGWHRRRKSHHAACYAQVANEFAEAFALDPWYFTPAYRTVGGVDFRHKQGVEALADAASDLFAEIRREYAARGITETPFLVMKADAGTYGMGVMVVKDPVELRELSRRDRNKMARVKEGLEVTQVIVQEGVPTFERVEGAAAEPVVYFIDHYVVGGFYRVHTERGPDDNLNAPGMHFTPLTFARPCSVPDFTAAPDAEPNRFYAYGVVARLALAAATREIESLNESHSDVAATPLATAR